MMILDCMFPPAVGYRSGKTYAYVTDDPNAEDAAYAVIRDPQNAPILVRVMVVRKYQPQSFKMKHVVKIITNTDFIEHRTKKGA